MLYDPKWEAKTKPAPFTLADFIAWLETKPPRTQYHFACTDGSCLMGQYMTERGRAWEPGKRSSTYVESCEQVFGDKWDVPVLIETPHTFGAALDRARAALVSSAIHSPK